MEKTARELHDNQMFQGYRPARTETNLDRLEQKVEHLADKLDHLESLVERNTQAIGKLADGFVLLQSALKDLSETVDRFIRRMEHNGHRSPETGPQEAH
jgi:hypothetical protein